MNIIQKGLAIAVITLFIGIAIAPSINANVSKEALVEFTTEVCGLNGGKQIVKLTQEEAEEVEALFDSIREQLNATDSREEAEEIFKEAVVELDKYGLLGGLSVKQAQMLVTGEYLNPKIMKHFERLFDKDNASFENQNFFCLIFGEADNAVCIGPIARNIMNLFDIFFLLFYIGLQTEWFYVVLIFFIMFLPLIFILSGIQFVTLQFPFDIFNTMFLGAKTHSWYAYGSLDTFGLLGKKTLSGPFCGNLPFKSLIGGGYFVWNDTELDFIHPAAIGFTGLCLMFNPIDGTNLVMGFTPWISLTGE